ncbi:hypothetical protein ABH924_003301 [Arthrobacter sp. GAS37]|uniref:hypothetical protein n=1 Tax=Arthrobacter sp. GAS37 TaxID=3156261 RepID=UPI003835DED4
MNMLWDRLAHWNSRHCFAARTGKGLLLWFALIVAGAAAAHADTGGQVTAFIGLPTNIRDSHGISIAQYATLPLDRGDAWTWQKGIISLITDIIWAGHIYYISWFLAILKMLLAFEWVGWLATPVQGFATNLQNLTNQLGIVPLAILVAGIFGSVMIMRGRLAQGISEWFAAGLIAVLVTTVLANPVASITGPDGFLTKAKTWGGELSLAITNDPTCSRNAGLNAAQGIQAATCPSTSIPADQVLTDTVMTQISDVFVRLPAITLTFGKPLSAECSAIFDTKIKERNPLDVGETAVRNAVGDCDKDAKFFVESPFPNKVLNAFIVSTGTIALNLIGWGMAIFALWNGFSALWNALTSTVKGVFAIVGPMRMSFWRAFVNIGVALGLLVLSTVFLAAWMKLITFVMVVTSPLGLQTQMLFVDLMVLLFIIWLIVMKRRANKAGEKLAQKLAKLTGADPTPVGPGLLSRAWDQGKPLMKDIARDAIRDRRRNAKKNNPDARPGPSYSPPHSPLVDLGEKGTGFPLRNALGPSVRKQLTTGPGNPGTPGPTPPSPTGPKGLPAGPTPAGTTAGKKGEKVGQMLDIAATAAQFIPHPAAQAAGKIIKTTRTIQQGAKMLQSPNRIRKDPTGKAVVDRPLEGIIIDPPSSTSAPTRTARAESLAARLASRTASKPVTRFLL